MTDLPTSNKNEPFLRQIQDDEENHNIVLSIREELMERVMDECYKSYIRKQTVKFIVQCAYDAFVKYLTFDFYYHPEVPDVSQPIWIADEPIEPSPRDTWACDAVPIRPVDFKEEDEDGLIYESLSGTTNKTSSKDHSSSEIKSCICLEHVCTCLTAPEELGKKLDSTYSKPCPSKVKFSPKSSRHSIKPSSSTSEKHETSSYDLHQSYPTASNKSLDKSSSRDTTASSSNTIGAKRGKRNKSFMRAQEEREVVIDVPPDTLHGSQAAVIELPPIRLNSTFRSKPAECKKKSADTKGSNF